VLREPLRGDPERDRHYGGHGDGDTADKEDDDVVKACAGEARMRKNVYMRKWEGDVPRR
jgi:hypothetical protein